MEGLIQLRCKKCGESLDPARANDGVITCPVCDEHFIMPKPDTSSVALSYLRNANERLDLCEFDKAYSLFAQAAQHNPEESEAYFGMALATFNVQYIRDLKDKKGTNLNDKSSYRLQPICHKLFNKRFSEDKNYQLALSYATPAQNQEYRRKAEEIDYVRNEFLKLEQSGLDYDCFICVKVSKMDDEQTDPNKKNWTDDAYDADAIYDILKMKGFKPFFSEREIRGRAGVDYEAMILYALYKSESMIVVCHNEEYLRTPWVNNEFTRFKELVNNEEKENDSLTIVYKGTPIERLPDMTKGKIQGIDFSRRGAEVEIIDFVERHTPQARARREEEQRRRERRDEDLRIRGQQAGDGLNNFAPTKSETDKADKLLIRAKQELNVRNFDKARDFYEKILEDMPSNGAAWWGLFKCEIMAVSEDEILQKLGERAVEIINKSHNYKYARQYAQGRLREDIIAFNERLKQGVNRKATETNINLNKLKSNLSVLVNQKKQCEQQIAAYRNLTENKQPKNSKWLNKKLFSLSFFMPVAVVVSILTFFVNCTGIDIAVIFTSIASGVGAGLGVSILRLIIVAAMKSASKSKIQQWESNCALLDAKIEENINLEASIEEAKNGIAAEEKKLGVYNLCLTRTLNG